MEKDWLFTTEDYICDLRKFLFNEIKMVMNMLYLAVM